MSNHSDRRLARIRVSREFFFCEREDSTCANWVLSVVQSRSSSFLRAPVSPGPPRRRTENDRNVDERDVERLQNATGGRARISYSNATGVARFVSVADDAGRGSGSHGLGRHRSEVEVFGIHEQLRRIVRSAGFEAARARTRRGRRLRRAAPSVSPVLQGRARLRGDPEDALRRRRPAARRQRHAGPGPRPRRQSELCRDGRVRRRHSDGERRACGRRRGDRPLGPPHGVPRGSGARPARREPPRLAGRSEQRRRRARVHLRRCALGQDRRPAARHLRRHVPACLRRPVSARRSAGVSGLAVLGRGAAVPDGRRRSQQHDHLVQRGVRLLQERLRPRLL